MHAIVPLLHTVLPCIDEERSADISLETPRAEGLLLHLMPFQSPILSSVYDLPQRENSGRHRCSPDAHRA